MTSGQEVYRILKELTLDEIIALRSEMFQIQLRLEAEAKAKEKLKQY